MIVKAKETITKYLNAQKTAIIVKGNQYEAEERDGLFVVKNEVDELNLYSRNFFKLYFEQV